MVDQPIPISEIADPDLIRVQLLASGRPVHAPLSALGAFYDWATVTHAAAAKTTPADADEFSLVDSAAGNVIKKITWANIKATLKTYFDTLYQPLAAALTSWAAITRASGFDTFAATPSSANLRALLTDETGTGFAVFAEVGSSTPTVGSASGTITSASATLDYVKIGANTVVFWLVVTITTNGTGAGAVTATLPFTPLTSVTVTGRDTNVSGKTLNSQSTGATLSLFNYDNSYPGANGAVLRAFGVMKI